MKRIVGDTVKTKHFMDANKSNVYIAMLDGREALLVTQVAGTLAYITTALSVHATNKVVVDASAEHATLTGLLEDFVNTGYEVCEFDSIVDALDYLSKNM